MPSKTSPTSHCINSIAVFYCDHENRYDLPRQGVLNQEENLGKIKLNNCFQFEQVLAELDGFDRIWLIWQFHLNHNWKSMVSPPAHTANKVGVFASRSPHRPNGLGLSCVKLKNIDVSKGELLVSEFDLLNGTPIFDIKPYISYADSFADAKSGWAQSDEQLWQIEFKEIALKDLEYIKEYSGPDFKDFIVKQLEHQPSSNKRKRVTAIKPRASLDLNKHPQFYLLAYRTWRIKFTLDEMSNKVTVLEITSGYSGHDLIEPEDKYQDKDLHRMFNNFKGNQRANLT